MMRRVLFVVGLLLVLGSMPLLAQDSAEYPTLAALEAANVPPRDLTDLAQRLQGVTDIAPPPINPEPLTLGTVKTFWADNSSADFSFQMEAELRAIGEHIYIWVEKDADLPQAGLDRLATEFDKLVYQPVRDLWGSEASPGVDGDLRVHAVFASNLGYGVGAYYAAKHSYPIEAVPTSNEHEMLFYNLDALSYIVGMPMMTTITAHEFQHMIRANVDQNEDGWMDEGFSTFTEFYLGDSDMTMIMSYMNLPGTQLNTWTEDGSRIADYGASQLWVTYLYERFGIEGLNQLSQDPANGFVGVEHLALQHGTTADELFADWVVANVVQDPTRTSEGIYGYTEFDGLPRPYQVEVETFPVAREVTVNQYSAYYLTHTDVNDLSQLTLSLDVPAVVGLADTDSPSNTPMWYSNRGDDSNMHLTVPLDLTGTQAPVLSYDLWYRIEALWDYAYVMVSTTDGATWDILQTPTMTTEDPDFNAFGAGYSGLSGGGTQPMWLHEKISLADYAGQDVLLRFELINDDAVNREGVLLDAVQVHDGDTLIWRDDFGGDMSAWQTEGWILTDNRLPQGVWVQAVQTIGDSVEVSRWQVFDGGDTMTLPLTKGADRVTWVIAPFAPTTTTPATITLNVTAQ